MRGVHVASIADVEEANNLHFDVLVVSCPGVGVGFVFELLDEVVLVSRPSHFSSIMILVLFWLSLYWCELVVWNSFILAEVMMDVGVAERALGN